MSDLILTPKQRRLMADEGWRLFLKGLAHQRTQTLDAGLKIMAMAVKHTTPNHIEPERS